jgi:hypothetical protein
MLPCRPWQKARSLAACIGGGTLDAGDLLHAEGIQFANSWADLPFLLLCPGEILDRRLKPQEVEVVRESAAVSTRARSAAHLPN